MPGDFIFSFMPFLSMLIPIAIFCCIVFFLIRFIRRTERRSDEKIKLEKENKSTQQQQIDTLKEMNERLTRIENLLKEVN
jgi:large-conductance mechanosensitive channel